MFKFYIKLTFSLLMLDRLSLCEVKHNPNLLHNSVKLDLIFLVDGSGSVGHKNFEHVKEWVTELSSVFNISNEATRIGVIQYSRYEPSRAFDQQDFIKTEVELGAHQKQTLLADSVKKISLQGELTYTAQAILKVIQDFEASDRFNDASTPKLLILITDGMAGDHGSLGSSLDKVQEASIVLFSIAIGTSYPSLTQDNELENGMRQMFFAREFDTLETVNEDLEEAISELTLQIKQLDLIFLLDGSGSFGIDSFDIVKQLVSKTSSYFPISTDATRIGVIQYSYYDPFRSLDDQPFVKTEIDVGKYLERQQFNEAVMNIEYQGESTFTAAGLRKALLDFKSSERFNDSSTEKVLVVVTDGRSSDVARLQESSDKLKGAGIKSVAIGVGQANIDELLVIADDYLDRVLYLDNFGDLTNLAIELARLIKS